jgi:hypothetical protein
MQNDEDRQGSGVLDIWSNFNADLQQQQVKNLE